MTAPKIIGTVSASIGPKMNGLEAEYASMLEARKMVGEILHWHYEAVKLRLAGRTYYSPDFMVVLANREVEFHEVKGKWKGSKAAHWEDDARVKIKVAATLFPYRFMAASKKDGGWIYEQFKNY